MSRLIVAVALLLIAETASTQSLGEAAAKERQRREKQAQKAPARVITEAELATNGGRLANDSTAAPASATPASTSAPVRNTSAPPPAVYSVETERVLVQERESHWRSEAQRRRERLAEAERTVQQTDRWSDPTYAGKDRPSCSISRRAEQARARAELAQARRSLDALQEEARVGGALPGWIR